MVDGWATDRWTWSCRMLAPGLSGIMLGRAPVSDLIRGLGFRLEPREARRRAGLPSCSTAWHNQLVDVPSDFSCRETPSNPKASGQIVRTFWWESD